MSYLSSPYFNQRKKTTDLTVLIYLHQTYHRGVVCAIFVKEYLAATKVSFECNFIESVWCQINLNNNEELVIGCVYRSPNSTMENNQNLYQLLNIVNNSHFSHILVTGDFNCKEIDWKLLSTSVNENHNTTFNISETVFYISTW